MEGKSIAASVCAGLGEMHAGDNIYSQCTHTETCIWDLVGEPAYEDSMND